MVKIAGVDAFIGRIMPRSVKRGIAFGGGGVRGFCHVGVIRAFEQFGLAPSVLSGVSAGSIAAVLYGSGLTSSDILECFAGETKFGHYADWMIPRRAFFRMTKFARLLESWLPVSRLEEMKIPTVVCATDFDNAKSVGWAKGEIVPRVIASCSIPVVFPPVTINGTHYVDGGVLRNLPAWAIRKHCNVLYGSNCSPLNRAYTYKETMIDTALRSYQMMSKANTLQDINLCDFVIQPSGIAQVSTFDLSKIEVAVEAGYSTACRVLEDSLMK